jgi:RNA polymerase sigma-70 factor (ECF subfamily)
VQRRTGFPRKHERGHLIPIDLETVAEARVVAQALAGSQTAFEQILRRYQRPVLSLLVRLTGDSGLAEDLAQETFVKAFRNLAAFDPRRRLSSWLFRIAHNTGIDALRKTKLPTVPIDEGELRDEPAAPPTGDPVVRRALGRALDGALHQLRPDQRTAVVLRYEAGLSFDEIGQVLGIPEPTARSHVHRARKELARLLTEAGWTPDR